LKVDDFLSSKFSEQTTLLRNDVANGVKTTEQANQELKTWTDEQYKELSASLPMHVQHQYKAQIDSAVGRQARDSYLCNSKQMSKRAQPY
jgi:hypothetical protein